MRTLISSVLFYLLVASAHAQSFSGGIPLPGLPKSLGNKTMANSTSVTIASDQTPIGVTGTFSATNPSVGPNYATAPVESNLIGYIDGNGDLHPFLGDSNGITVTALQGSTPWVTSRNWVLSNSTDSVTVTGTVISSQSGAWDIRNITGTVSLPTGAATELTLANNGVTLSAIGVTMTAISGQLPASLGQKDSNNSLAVVIANDQSSLPITGTVTAVVTPITTTASTITRVANSASSQSLLSANGSRRAVFFYNDSTTNCYIKFGTTASLTSFTLKMFSTDTYIMDPPIYTGAIDYICDAASGSMEATEQ